MLSEREFRKFLARITSSTQQVCYLSGRMIIDEQFVQLLQAISTVKDQREIALHLSNNRITDSGLEQALAYIQESTRLITIDLSFNQVSDTGVSKLLEVIQNNVWGCPR